MNWKLLAGQPGADDNFYSLRIYKLAHCKFSQTCAYFQYDEKYMALTYVLIVKMQLFSSPSTTWLSVYIFSHKSFFFPKCLRHACMHVCLPASYMLNTATQHVRTSNATDTYAAWKDGKGKGGSQRVNFHPFLFSNFSLISAFDAEGKTRLDFPSSIFS